MKIKLFLYLITTALSIKASGDETAPEAHCTPLAPAFRLCHRRPKRAGGCRHGRALTGCFSSPLGICATVCSEGLGRDSIRHRNPSGYGKLFKLEACTTHIPALQTGLAEGSRVSMMEDLLYGEEFASSRLLAGRSCRSESVTVTAQRQASSLRDNIVCPSSAKGRDGMWNRMFLSQISFCYGSNCTAKKKKKKMIC